jgi:hypothetical protein
VFLGDERVWVGVYKMKKKGKKKTEEAFLFSCIRSRISFAFVPDFVFCFLYIIELVPDFFSEVYIFRVSNLSLSL